LDPVRELEEGVRGGCGGARQQMGTGEVDAVEEGGDFMSRADGAVGSGRGR